MKLDYNIKELIKKYAALIETNNFNQLYSDIDNNYQLSRYIPDLTRVLESAKIYPLEYMTYIPTWMYYESETSEIKIPNNIERIHRKAFESAHAETITMTDNVRYLGDTCFYGCKQLTNIKLSNNLEVIPKYCFEDCIKLESIELPSNCNVIDFGAFANCEELREVSLGKDVELIGGFNFSDCSNLESITYLGTKKQFIGKNLPRNWFGGSSIEVVRCTDGDIKL